MQNVYLLNLLCIAVVFSLYVFYSQNTQNLKFLFCFDFYYYFLRFQQVKCKNLPRGAGSKILEQLFREANVQSHIHKIRHTFFKSLQCLLGKCLTGENHKVQKLET